MGSGACYVFTSEITLGAYIMYLAIWDCSEAFLPSQ